MVKFFYFALMLSIIPLTSLAACQRTGDKAAWDIVWPSPDSVAYKHLGKNLTTILFTSTKVECYQLEYKERPSSDDIEVETCIVRGKQLDKLTREQLAVLRFLLFTPSESYQEDSIRVRSPYAPVLEFVFYHKKLKQNAQVILSPNDMTWTVIFDDKRQFNYNFTNKEAVLRFCEYFLSKVTTHNE